MENIIQKYFSDNDLRYVLVLFLIYVIYVAILSLTSFMHIIPRSIPVILHWSTQYLLAAAEEESLFRFVPLVIAFEKNIQTKGLIIISIACSVGFALIHGAYLEIFTTGVLGFLMSIIFIGLNRRKEKRNTFSNQKFY